jgi:hypothetical protein
MTPICWRSCRTSALSQYSAICPASTRDNLDPVAGKPGLGESGDHAVGLAVRYGGDDLVQEIRRAIAVLVGQVRLRYAFPEEGIDRRRDGAASKNVACVTFRGRATSIEYRHCRIGG